ncbi:MAG: hypothetical protein IPM42_04410 [Saprospiraceae bacterium]|nr:hypothetical protein [Saprospiraceae bacterium]
MEKRFSFILTIVLIFALNIVSGQDPFYTTDRNLPCIERKFYVYVHVTLDSLGNTNISKEQIRQHLQNANKAFAPICISFDYCKIDTVRDYSFDFIDDEIEVGLIMSRFHKSRRLNLYFTGAVMSEEINSFSIHNGITKEDSCVVIVPKSGLGLMHELGHTFGLLHTFDIQNGIERADGSNCESAGDLICDTPADPGILPPEDCSFNHKFPDENGDYYRTEIGNFMTHYFCAHCFYTTEQYEKMAETYLNSTFKMW